MAKKQQEAAEAAAAREEAERKAAEAEAAQLTSSRAAEVDSTHGAPPAADGRIAQAKAAVSRAAAACMPARLSTFDRRDVLRVGAGASVAAAAVAVVAVFISRGARLALSS